jgi:hypothetical protein
MRVMPLPSAWSSKEFRADHLFGLTPVIAHALDPAIAFEDFLRLAGKLTQYRMIRAAEPHLQASAAARALDKPEDHLGASSRILSTC